MTIRGNQSNSPKFVIELPDIQVTKSFESSNITYDTPRDYLKSGVKILQKEEIIPNNKGVTARVESSIPIQVGLSSSSALCVIWIAFLAELFDVSLSPAEITKFAHKAEVVEFNEPGGMQDHMAIAYGYLNYEEFNPVRCTRLLDDIPGIVIGNSLEKKDTLNTLASIKQGVMNGLSFFEVSHVTELSIEDIENVKPRKNQLDKYSFSALKAAVINYNLTRKAYLEFKKGRSALDEAYVGKLMTKHHRSLRDYLSVSTPKLEVMIQAALDAGALGCKVTGSGNGGCMIAFAPGCENEVSSAIEKVGGKSHIAHVVPGVSRIDYNSYMEFVA
jgi:galactokinase